MANILVTDVGLAALVNAQKNGTLPIVLKTVQFGTGKYVPSKSQEALTNPFKTLSTISGGGVGDNVIHLTVNDVSSDKYDVFEFGVFTDQNVLFAVYSQDTPIIQKASGSQALLALDFVVADASSTDITTGDTTFINPPSTTEMSGVVELATTEEVLQGIDATRVVTAASLRVAIKKAGEHIEDNSLNGSKLLNGSVVTTKLKNESVTNEKIANKTLTSEKIKNQTLTFELFAASVTATLDEVKKGGVNNKLVTADVLKAYAEEVKDLVCPVGICQCLVGKTAPEGWLELDGSRVMLEDAPRLVRHLWQYEDTKGDGRTYAVLPNADGKVFQGTLDVSQVCVSLKEELPNIIGSGKGAIWDCTGSLAVGNYKAVVGGGSSYGTCDLYLNADRSSSLYKGSKLQPSALQLLACIRC